MNKILPLLLGAVVFSASAFGHDTWLQTNTAVVRTGEVVYIEFLLGNHGNGHRDFKIAGKPSLETSRLVLVAPDGSSADFKPALVDRGYTPKDGYWAARYAPRQPGLYLVAQTGDQVVTYAPERVVRSAKVFFLAAAQLDQVPAAVRGFDRVLGHPLELVPLANPVALRGPGTALRLRLLFHGQPLAGATVSFIPQDGALTPAFDPRYERVTDDAGTVAFVPPEANRYLVVTHHLEPNEGGPGYQQTLYGATLTVLVPTAAR
jgi:uncharacterized GH25 family protein